ncbi:phosphatase 2C-like domain-containing protein [Myxozyma melibiosi]|uniref:Phosphatase 2C-like domain-containing protein n=1 Tax=Myxozyma melibiosi TaxID=54550 RepID=A0ABR1FEX1_9ASCO
MLARSRLKIRPGSLYSSSHCYRTTLTSSHHGLPRRASLSSSSKQSTTTTSRTKIATAAAVVATAAASACYVNYNKTGLIHNDTRPVEPSKLPPNYAAVTGPTVELPRPFSTKSTRMLDDHDVSSRIREHEESYTVDRNSGVTRFDVDQLASNPQIEDDFVVKVVNVDFADGKHDWCFFGVFDGHGGWNTSAKLRELLVPYVARELTATIEPSKVSSAYSLESPENASKIDEAIQSAFLRLDDDIVKKPFNYLLENPSMPASAEMLMPAMSGSCALLSVYDAATSTLRVACTGDSRAVWGHRNQSGEWTATPLSYDQCGRNQSEAQRIRSEHPGESGVIERGRVLGRLEPTRAFGDARYKLPQNMINNAVRMFFGRVAPDNSVSPPYVTAKPDVVTAKVQPGDFLILATDGIWDEISSTDAVQLVVEWVKKHEVEHKGLPPPGVHSHVRKGGILAPISDHSDVKIVNDTAAFSERMRGGHARADSELRRSTAPQKRFKGMFVIEDDNAAAHIIRNSLGGADKDRTAMLLSIPPGSSRRYRDDMTCLVVFFGDKTEQEASGKITPIK